MKAISIPKILTKLLIFLILYFIHLIVINTLCKIFEHKYSFRTYTFPILSISTLSSLTQTSFLLSIRFYSLIYFISSCYLGILVNSFYFGILYRIINKIYKINFFFGIILVIFFPIFLSIFGIINARKIFIKEYYFNFNDKKFVSNSKIKIIHLSDIHLGAIYKNFWFEKIIEKIIKIDFDIIVITGDLFDSSFYPNLSMFNSINKIKKPILFITGNHEDVIGKNNILKLIDLTGIIHIGDNINPFIYNDFNFFGIDYDENFFCKIEEINNKIKNNNNNNFENNKNKNSENNRIKINILLSHIPYVNAKELNNYDEIDLMLCGHTLGGQFFPLSVGIYFFNKCFVGVYKYLNKYVFVNQGCGTFLFPMRIGSNNEISIINVSKNKI